MLNEDCIGTCQTSWNTPTTEKMLEVVKKAQAIPRPEWDVIVCTDKSWTLLKEGLQVYTIPTGPHSEQQNSIVSLPVHLAGDMIEVIAIAVDLAKAGKKVMIIEEKNGQLKVWESSWYDNLVKLTETYKWLVTMPDLFYKPPMETKCLDTFQKTSLGSPQAS